MSNRICFQLLYLTSAAVPGWTFSKCPAERKAVDVVCYFMTTKLINYIILMLLTTVVIHSCGQTKSQPKAMSSMTNKTEVQVLSLTTISEEKEEFQLTFGAVKDTTLQLTMKVGKYEAQTLAITLKKIKSTAPLPLDILEDAITKFGHTVKEVIVDSLIKDIFTAKIICIKENNETDFKARPVDATTIALKFNAPIFVRTDLLKH
jgi:bifunctional DNase/RNase